LSIGHVPKVDIVPAGGPPSARMMVSRCGMSRPSSLIFAAVEVLESFGERRIVDAARELEDLVVTDGDAG
jgi:hypothetical protein